VTSVVGSATSPSIRRDSWAAAVAELFSRLFAVCGAASVRCVDAQLSVLLASLSGQFAWHAELVGDLVATPPTAGPDGESAAIRDVVAQLGSLDVDGDGVSMCVALSSLVLPWVRDVIEQEHAATEPRLEGPRARALLLISRDVADALAATTTVRRRLAGEGEAPGGALAPLVRALSDARAKVGTVGGESIG
jgi:hypothetical protein